MIVGDGQVIGLAYRWHRNWFVLSTEGETNLNRPPTGKKGVDTAALHLFEAYTAGRITAVTLTKTPLQPLYGPVPLLEPRLPNDRNGRNAESAHKAFARYAAYDWRALSGFPGSDNHQLLLCERCGWIGPRYFSHLRGRNGGPPPAKRHEAFTEGHTTLPWLWDFPTVSADPAPHRVAQLPPPSPRAPAPAIPWPLRPGGAPPPPAAPIPNAAGANRPQHRAARRL